MKDEIMRHRNLGAVRVTEACRYLQSTNPDQSSTYVEHDGDIKEVTKDLVVPMPRHVQEHVKHCRECQDRAFCVEGQKLLKDWQTVAARIDALPKR